MVGVTKKEVSQMTKYYLKMDNIMKNMFVVALNDELQAQSEQDECLEETKALLKKVSEYDLAQKRLQITAGEQRQIRKALNRLRSKYLAAGRYSDGIDKVIIQVAKPNTSVLAYWHLAKYFWLLLPFYGTIKETAVISYGKTKKIQNQTYG